MKVLLGACLFSMLLGCTTAQRSKKDGCGATVSVAPQPVLGRSAAGESAGNWTVGVCRE